MKVYQTTLWSFGLFLDLVICIRISPPNNPASKRFTLVPKIRLVDYRVSEEFSTISAEPQFQALHQYQNEFLSKNGSEYVIFEGLSSVTFECKAKFPVLWKVPHPEHIKYLNNLVVISTSEYRSSFDYLAKPINRFFLSWLTIYEPTNEVLSVNLTCESANPGSSPEPEHQSSIYIFTRGPGPKMIERQGETIQLSVCYNNTISKDEHFVLPCRPAGPDLQVILEKQASNLTSFVEIQSSPYLSFDPKVGFTMSKRLLGSNLFGLYRCRFDKDDIQMEESDIDNPLLGIQINVTKCDSETAADETNKNESFKPYSWMNGNATVVLSDTFVSCCSGLSEIVPEMVIESCHSVGRCKMAEILIMEKIKHLDKFSFVDPAQSTASGRNDCSSYHFYGASSMVYCKGGNLEFLQNYVPAFYPYAMNIPERSKMTKKDLIYYDTVEAVARLPRDHKYFLSVGKIERIKYFDEAFVPIAGDYFQAYGSWDLRGDNIPIIDSYSVRIWEYDRNHYFHGEPLTFTCLALRPFYTGGIQLYMLWKNGTKTSLTQANYADATVYFSKYFKLNDHYNSAIMVYHYFSEEMSADLEMESVLCYLPPWDTPAWHVFKYDLDIRSPVPPKVESEEDFVYFNINDTDMKISFNVFGGQPIPTINVFKNDKLIKRNSLSKNINNFSNTDHMDCAEVFPMRDDDVVSNRDMDIDVTSIANVTIEEKIGLDTVSDSSFIVTILFPNVTYDIQGTYRCVAESVNTNVTKSIQVIVSVRKSKTATIIIGFVLVLGITLLGIGIWYKCQHRTVQTLRFGINRL